MRELRRRLGDGAVITDPDARLVYESDGLPYHRRRPAAVVLPLDTDQAAFAVARLHGAGIPVVPRGGGTGLSGGALAGPDAVVLGTARMRRILALEPAHRAARVEAGVLNADLSTAAAPFGLHYAPDPSSQTACTLGGNVAENSGGPHCLKYGVTSRYITGLTVVGAHGEVQELGGVEGRPAPDLVGVFVGSEGCFGIATEIEVRLVPIPEAFRTLLVAFARLEDAGAAVTAIMARGLLPAALEILDHATITAVEDSIFAAGYPRDAAAVLVIEFDGPDTALDDDAEHAERICSEWGATEIRRARTAEDRAQLWKGRKKAFGAMGRLGADLVVQDATVPRSRLPSVLVRIGEIAAEHDLRVANVFHAGDGNLHPNILFDRRSAEQTERVALASRAIMVACVEAGGTITGEHGVGIDKRDYMSLVHGPAELDMLRRVQRVFDPSGLWNPGKVVPDGPEPRPLPHLPPDPGRQRDLSRLAHRLEAIAGLDTQGGGDLDRGGAPGEGRRPWVTPRHADAVAELLRQASSEGWRVAPVGSTEAATADVVLRTEGLAGIAEYEPADLTLTAGAGTPIADLAAAAEGAGQWFPVDAPGLEGATLGGVVARGVEGALAGTYGAVRDLVLGLTLVTGDGRPLRLGGRVVKNVAGFDLVRLVVGSRGALGVLTEVTIRLFPRPAVDRSWTLSAERPERLVGLAQRIAGLALPPASVEVGWGPLEATLAIRLLGSSSAVAEGWRRIAPLVPDARECAPGEGSAARARLRAPSLAAESHTRWSGPAGGLDALLARARAYGAEVGADSAGWLLADRGVAWIGLPTGARPSRSESSTHDGAAARWVRGLKQAFDPMGVLPQGPFGGAAWGD